MRLGRLIALYIILLIPMVASASGYYSQDNIYTVPDRPPNSLEMGVRTAYPANIDTVGQAVMYILGSTDYKVAVGYPASTSAAAILTRPIPPEAIQDKVMPIYQALLILIGDDSRLVVDTKHKLVTFETIPGKE